MKLTNNDKRDIINKQILAWEADRYGLEVSHRVHTRLGNKEGMAKIESDMVKCEMAIDLLGKELQAVPPDHEEQQKD